MCIYLGGYGTSRASACQGRLAAGAALVLSLRAVMMRGLILIGVGWGWVTAASAAGAMATSRPADPCGRRAAAHAFAELTARLLRLPMSDRQTVDQWIGSRTAIDLALRRAAYESAEFRFAEPPRGGGCRVEASIVLSEVARAWARRLRVESLIPAQDLERELEQIRRWSVQAEGRRLTAAGVGDDLPRGTTSQPSPAVGWEHLPPEALDIARRAAVSDAVERMRARCRELRVSQTETLGDVFDVYGAVEDAFLRRLARRIRGDAVFEPFTVCRQPLSMSLGEIADTLAQAVRDASAEAALDRLELRAPSEDAGPVTLSVEGAGSPPPVRLAWPGQFPAVETPAWANETLTAIGQAQVEDALSDATVPDAARAAAAAEARQDAVGNMWSQVDELVLPDGRRFRDVLESHPELSSDLKSLEGRMRAVGPPEWASDGRVSVKIVMPLGPLWDVAVRVLRQPAPSVTTGPGESPATQSAGGQRVSETPLR